jgi:hypothetical protein
VPWFGKTTKPRKEKRSPATAVQYIHAFCAFSHDQGRCQVALTAFHFFHEISSSQRAPTSTPLPAPQADFLIACRRFSFAPHASHQAGLGWAGLGFFLGWLFGVGASLGYAFSSSAMCHAIHPAFHRAGSESEASQGKEGPLAVSRLRLLDLARFDACERIDSV